MMRHVSLFQLPPLAVGFMAAFTPSAAPAQVHVKVLEDGTRLIYNESKTQRARRTAGHLLPVPSADLGAWIDLHARRQGLDARLVQAVIQVESGYNAAALSSKGAMGLMQLMPATARMLRIADPYHPEQNIRGGTLYLRRMLDRYSGDLTLALAAYNAGPTAVDRHGGVPPYRETRSYIRKVASLYRNGAQPSTLLREHARTEARRRDQEARTADEDLRVGDPVYLRRDASGRVLITTSPSSKLQLND